ncbi:hypothetical protein JOF29_004094 [Kribbella aluminosa]|uniref:Uncharacterized protein n=1 Tax=Kribbella aluminosa TaxID=416017 RepID=A0ABS4UMZ5_9ACTN|nr:hypothetical protein [Kribbella aluminosa]MBP2353011.1 hypothetical protein [Kribbella aluminosa]
MRCYQQTVANCKLSTINTTLAAIGDLYLRLGLGAYSDYHLIRVAEAGPVRRRPE